MSARYLSTFFIFILFYFCFSSHDVPVRIPVSVMEEVCPSPSKSNDLLTLARKLQSALGVAITTQLKAIYCPLFVEHGSRTAFGGAGSSISPLSPFILLSLISFISLFVSDRMRLSWNLSVSCLSLQNAKITHTVIMLKVHTWKPWLLLSSRLLTIVPLKFCHFGKGVLSRSECLPPLALST